MDEPVEKIFSEGYLAFRDLLGDPNLADIQRILGYNIRDLAHNSFGVGDEPKADSLDPFFTAVQRTTGETRAVNSEGYYSELVRKWKKSSNRSLCLATYYYLHTTRTGQRLAAEIDHAVFKGKTFREHHGFGVPGGYEPEQYGARDIAVQAQILEVVQDIADKQKEGIAQASVELLLSLAREYDAAKEGNDVTALREFLAEKIAEWHRWRDRLQEIERAGDHDNALIAEARAAIDRGDYLAADTLIAEEIVRAEAEAARSLQNEWELLEIRAQAATLFGDRMAAARSYDRASALAALVDQAKSIGFAHSAANELYLEEYHKASIPILDVAQRYRDLIARINRSPDLPDWQKAGPAMSYCDILSRLSERGEGLGSADAEKECRAALASFADSSDPLIPAFLQSILGGILTDNAAPDRLFRLREATQLHEDALRIITPSAPFNLWIGAQTRFGLTLVEMGTIEHTSKFNHQAISVFETLLKNINRPNDSDTWSRAHHNIAMCRLRIGQATNNVYEVRLALPLLENALQDRQIERTPLLYARTRTSIGDVHLTLGHKFGLINHFPLALNAYRETLTIWNPGVHKTEWWGTAHGYFQACVGLIKATRDSKAFKAAILISKMIVNFPRTGNVSHDPLILYFSLINDFDISNISSETMNKILTLDSVRRGVAPKLSF